MLKPPIAARSELIGAYHCFNGVSEAILEKFRLLWYKFSGYIVNR